MKKIILTALCLSSIGIVAKAQYCTPIYSETCPDVFSDIIDINDVIIKNSLGATVFSHTGTSCGTDVTGTYSDFTSLTPVVLTPGAGYNATINTNFLAGLFYSVWVDFNNDNDFDDIGERIGYETGPTGTGSYIASWTFPIAIPAAAATGLHRMRIIMSHNQPAATACGPYAAGETHDYSVNIGGTPMSVSIYNFSGKYSNGFNTLTWHTSQVKETVKFEIERNAMDKGNSWTVIASSIANKTEERNKFQSVDYKPLAGLNQYRIKQTEKSGVITYSSVVHVFASSITQAYVYPTITKGQVNIESTNQNDVLYIASATGKLIKTIRFNAHNPSNVVDLTGYNSGMYFFNLKNESGTSKVFKIIKQD